MTGIIVMIILAGLMVTALIIDISFHTDLSDEIKSLRKRVEELERTQSVDTWAKDVYKTFGECEGLVPLTAEIPIKVLEEIDKYIEKLNDVQTSEG